MLPDELPGLQPEVRDWEPQALVAGAQTGGARRGGAGAPRPGGHLVLECHELRAGEVASGLGRLGYEDAAVTRDLAGRERVVEARWRAATP